MSSGPEAIASLLQIMARLRDPENGCPWDIKQTFSSIVPSTLEETYELVDAIEQADYQQISEELGDVLFQVLFYSRMAQEAGQFDFADVANQLSDKLLRRHPHVFPQGRLDSYASQGSRPDESEVKRSWEAIKAQERADKTLHGLLDDIPRALPAINRAGKLQKRAAAVAFDFASRAEVFAKIREELCELEQACEQGDRQGESDELGDVFFSLVNLARHLDHDPETSLRKANQRFETRFRYIEARLQEAGLEPATAGLQRMDELWEEAKSREHQDSPAPVGDKMRL